MIYRDLREWIDHLEKAGELLRLKEEIKLEPDAGAIARALSDVQGPAILSESIFGFQDARLAIGLGASWRRAAMALGLPKEASPEEQVKAWGKALERYPVKTQMVAKKDAICKQNILRGEEVNLFDFPIPRAHLQDAGPFITKTECITKDSDSDWINVGTYRMQVLDRNRTAIHFSGQRHIAEHYIRARRNGEPLEMAVAIGTDPAAFLAAAVAIPRGWDEFGFAGALRNEAIEIVPAETVDLPVPATAEIVLEGEITLKADLLEGPFSEFPGSYSGCFITPVFQIKAITHRDHPIYDMLLCGRPPVEGYYTTCIPGVSALQRELSHACPNITQIAYLLPYYFNCVIQGRWTYRGESRNAILATLASESNIASKVVIAVDEDIDPWNTNEVMWAIATRCQTNTDLIILPGLSNFMDPSAEVDGSMCKLGIDATKPIPSSPRHSVAGWVMPREGTEAWKERILRAMKGGEL
ncbi:MAG: UbiD family decarboxylase [Chloroflexi bacterium]|nr:UbiD family decarboxylase [Chloroflexota bacterium]